MDRPVLARRACDILRSKLIARGFENGILPSSLKKQITTDAVFYFRVHPQRRHGTDLLAPIVALENFRLRQIIGLGGQKEDAFAHMYLSYALGSGQTTWYIDSEDAMLRVVGEIEEALVNYALPLWAERYSDFDEAVELVCAHWERRPKPFGTILHVTKEGYEALLAYKKKAGKLD